MAVARLSRGAAAVARLRPTATTTTCIAPHATGRQAVVTGGARRWLNLHEHASIELMSKYGVPTPHGAVARSADEAEAVYEASSSSDSGIAPADMVIKAQILAGGRGVGRFKNGFQGGVHLVTRSGQAYDYAKKMIGEDLVTKQTGPQGRRVDKVFLMERVYMRRELYFSIVLDRASAGPVIVASASGGTSIEDIAESSPEAIMKMPVDVHEGLTEEKLDAIIKFLQFDEKPAAQAREAIVNLYRMFNETDATLLEINPMCETPEGNVLVCDAKINFDDNAEFRHPEIFAQRDFTQEDPREVEASKYNLNYIGLDGNIGCMVNGAGLAMATMDIIKLHGGSPANFLDVGGGATETQVQKAFEILNSDSQVKAIFVNIFGGIMRCDVIAQGILRAAEVISLRKPVVIRLQGTNKDEARTLIETSGHRMFMVEDMDEAAQRSVKLANIVEQAEGMQLNVNFELPL